jgi:hypothetical protein
VAASFVTIDDAVVKAIAFGLAVGILVDAFLALLPDLDVVGGSSG